MENAARTTDDDGVNLNAKVLPEFRDLAKNEAGYRARAYPGAVPGEKKGAGYLVTVAILHYLRLPPEERRKIYAEMRGVMDQRCKVLDPQTCPLVLPAYRVSDVPSEIISGHGVGRTEVRKKNAKRRTGEE